ncbi:MAG: hypothetical protein QOI74_1522, partial [Micromonosporaceae bacterium]|nr:hypothetical protein [Micromonosporaceae bacterium]
TFAVDWAPNVVTWFVDGIQYSRHTNADTSGNPWAFNHPFFLLLNVAVGGAFPGNPDATSTYPQQMLIDYIRVFGQDTAAPPPPPPAGGGGRIIGLGGKCVDVAGANPANGTPVQLWTCNGTAAQTWSVGGDGTVRALGKCLDVTAAATANGAPVQLFDCNGTNAQRWTATGGQLVNTGSNRCLDATGASSADGTRLQIWDCGGGTNQRWTINA